MTPAFAAANGGCRDADPLALPGQWRGVSDAGDDVQWLRFEVRSAAVVTLDVTVPLTAPGAPLLVVAGRDCDAPGSDDGFAYSVRTATHQRVLVRIPGEYYLRVTARDPALPLGPYKVTAQLDERPAPLTKDTEEWEIEPDPSGQPTSGGDGHGDTVTSATRLVLGEEIAFGEEVAGDLGNGWGDDSDVFRFTLAEPRQVRIETRGATDTVGALFDDRGYRLALDDDGGSGDNFRILEALVPGRYYVRVEGHGATVGAYTLSVETRAW